MGKLVLDVSISLDGYLAGPNPTLDDPLGEGGLRLHEWVIATRSWRAAHGREGGEDGVDSAVAAELLTGVGATVMGRRMFSGGAGPWESDPNADAWWGDDPPFHHPVFVVTHHPREPLVKRGGTTFTFVTDGVEAAVEQAHAAAGGGDVRLAGGADVAQQCLRAGLLDEMHLHVVPVLLGGGTRLLDGPVPDPPMALERTRLVDSPTGVAHLGYRVAR